MDVVGVRGKDSKANITIVTLALHPIFEPTAVTKLLKLKPEIATIWVS